MTGSTIYLSTSLLFGFAQIVDAIALWKKNGRLNPVIVAFSKAELIWAVVSFFIWREIEVPGWLPLSFTIYVASLIVVGIVIRRRIQKDGVPAVLALAGGVFGAYFAAASYAQLASK